MLWGDVNVNYLVEEYSKDFKEILALLGLRQLIKNATRICKTTVTLIDITTTNNCKNTRCASVFPSGFSDHEHIGCVRKPVQLNRDLLDADWTEGYGTGDINLTWNAFHKITSTLCDIHCPMISNRVKFKLALWLTVQLKIQMNDGDKLYRRYQKSKLDCDARAYQVKQNEVNVMLCNARRSNYYKDL